LAGLSLPAHLEGASFMDLLFDGDAVSDGVAVCQWFKGVTTIRENHFYTEWIDDKDQMFTRMLYDHSVDPDENVNVSEDPKNTAIIEELSAEMRRSRAADYFKEGP